MSLRATEGSAAIPPSVIARSSSSVIPTPSYVIPAKAGIYPSSPSPSSRDSSSSPSPLRGEGRVRVKYPFDLVSNPEFLREGSVVYDFTHPDKIVIGCENDKAKQIMQEICRPLYLIDTPFVFTTPETAELIKYAYNAFLATKITFINEIANLCDKVIISANKRQRELMIEKIKHLLGDLKDKSIGVLGLSFKQNTDDVRKSPSVKN